MIGLRATDGVEVGLRDAVDVGLGSRGLGVGGHPANVIEPAVACQCIVGADRDPSAPGPSAVAAGRAALVAARHDEHDDTVGGRRPGARARSPTTWPSSGAVAGTVTLRDADVLLAQGDFVRVLGARCRRDRPARRRRS